MSETTSIDMADTATPVGKIKGEKKVAAAGTAAAVGVGIGIAGTSFVGFEESGGPTTVPDRNVRGGDIRQESSLDNDAAFSSSPATNDAASMIYSDNVVEPQPIIDDMDYYEVVVEPVADSDISDGEIPAGREMDNVVEPLMQPEAAVDQVSELTLTEEPFSPDEMGEVIDLDEIGAVYTVEGENLKAASFHDGDLGTMVMVDVDADDMFDAKADYDGNLMAEDLEDTYEDMEDDEEYLAEDNDADDADGYGEDSFTDDIMA